jgi:bacillithiol synthase
MFGCACIVSVSVESHCIPFREIPHTAKLLQSFLEDFTRVSSYYAHPPTTAGIDAAAREVRLAPAVRSAVVEVLREQNRRFGPGNAIDSVTARNLDRLAAGAAAIVTGQQVGLFCGPAYTFYKALSAVRCVQETTSRGIDSVPIFWLASEDHDLAEVNHVFWNTRNGLAKYELPAKEEDAGRHVGEVLLGNAIEAIVAMAAESLEGPFASEVGTALRESYTPGETYGSAFGKLLARLLAGQGIIFMDPLDTRFHRLAAHVYSQALDESDSLREALLARSKDLEGAGFHAQVKVTRETTLLFYKVNGRREPLRSHNGKFVAGTAEFSREQLTAALKDAPESFTPSALLRSVVQDTLLPTAAYIGGPAELAYMAQTQVNYEKILGRMPAILPRASFTIVEQPIARFLAQYGLDIRDLFAGVQHLRAKMVQKSLTAGLASRFEAGEAALRNLLAEFKEPLDRLDPTLVEALQSSERKMLHQFEQLRAKAGRAENFRSGVLERHERILVDSLYPNGGLQERTLCALPMLASNGPGLVDTLLRFSSFGESADGRPCFHQHQILFL